MSTRSTNTMQEVLQRFLTDLAQAKTLMDADMPFILGLETQIVDYLRNPIKQMQAQGVLPQGGPDQGAQMQQMQQGGQGAPQQFPQQIPTQPGTAGGGGVMPGAAAPNADELRRLLGASQ